MFCKILFISTIMIKYLLNKKFLSRLFGARSRPLLFVPKKSYKFLSTFLLKMKLALYLKTADPPLHSEQQLSGQARTETLLLPRARSAVVQHTLVILHLQLIMDLRPTDYTATMLFYAINRVSSLPSYVEDVI